MNAIMEWFGIEEANVAYARRAEESPTIVAAVDEGDIGLLLPIRHNEHAAEVYLMAVRRDLHRRGVGRAMLDFLESDLRLDGCEYLQVKTLGPSRPDEHYDRTRSFYFSCGFRPVEEFTDLWGPENPALQMIKAL